MILIQNNAQYEFTTVVAVERTDGVITVNAGFNNIPVQFKIAESDLPYGDADRVIAAIRSPETKEIDMRTYIPARIK